MLLSFASNLNQNPELNFGGLQPGFTLPSADRFFRVCKVYPPASSSQ